MTNTKFRKRALLSSVAMLLVALVALGSATFAWFVANPTATATGLKMQTSAEAGIAVASGSVLSHIQDTEYTDAYRKDTILDATGTALNNITNNTDYRQLYPVSPKANATLTGGELTFGTIKAKESANEIGEPTAKFEDNTTYFYDEKIYLRTTTTDDGSATVQSAKVTITAAGGNNPVKNGLKVALVSSSNELIGIWKISGGSDTKVWNGDKDKVYGAAGTDVLATFSGTYIASGTGQDLTTPISVTSSMNSDGTTNNYIHMYVYLDGENTGVKSDNVPKLADLASAIAVSVSTAKVSG